MNQTSGGILRARIRRNSVLTMLLGAIIVVGVLLADGRSSFVWLGVAVIVLGAGMLLLAGSLPALREDPAPRRR
ncbi:hypothetical protein [Brachybacterium hainanense]|uniref:Uncharacterized protein n=1 Tax=Brachybacterium hainanense TaxID=1541174 RepID=A0ABV6RHY9_9MICO